MWNVVLQLLLVTSVFAAESGSTAKVKDVDAKNKVISLEAKGGQAGDRWVWKTGDESCVFQVYTMRGSISKARSSECESVKKVKVGDVLTLSRIDVVTAKEVPVSEPLPPPASERRKIVRERKNPELPTDNESWYVQLGAGMTGNSYQGQFKDTINAVDDLNGKTSRPIGFGIDFGFYWPLANQKTILGVRVEGSGDRYSNNSTGTTIDVSIIQRLLSFSSQHFFGANVGNGWFVRGDVGTASALMTYDDLIVTSKTKSGYGLSVGGGYAIPIGDDTRMLFFMNLSSRHFGSDRFTISTLGVDFLF